MLRENLNDLLTEMIITSKWVSCLKINFLTNLILVSPKEINLHQDFFTLFNNALVYGNANINFEFFSKLVESCFTDMGSIPKLLLLISAI